MSEGGIYLSWSTDHKCYSCSVPGCEDRQRFEAAVSACNNDGEHKGAGTLRIDCFKHRPQVQEGNPILYVPASGDHVGSPVPAMVLFVHNPQAVNLVAFVGGTWQIFSSVPYSAKSEFGTWHWQAK